MKSFLPAARRGRWGRVLKPVGGRRVAALTGFALLPGLLTPVAFAADSDPLGIPDVGTYRADKVSPFTTQANKAAAQTVAKAENADRAAAARADNNRAQKPVWPTAGTSTLKLTGDRTATAAPGALPVTLAQPDTVKGRKTPSAASVTVQVLDQQATEQLGIKGVALRVTGPAAGGDAELGINYAKFASAYGGDWAGRLRVSRLPDCALTHPAKAGCRTGKPLKSENLRKRNRITTPLSFQQPEAGARAATGQTMLLALAAGTQSGSGDYKATPLGASSSWEAGGSGGTFSWSYPLKVPPAAAGPMPQLSIGYDSGSVDGQTSSTNNQSTTIGEGFGLTSSYVERKYGSCDDDGQKDKGDLCWKYDNASLVLNGKATELVKDDTTGKWRLKSDDASTVTLTTGADNGDDNGEHWTVVTGEGTKYVFGLNKLDGAGAEERTKSVWTVPVFGDDAGEPGYADGATFATREKKQAWRWNLDYVVDTHNNAMTYWYETETNNYDKLGDDTTGTSYIRGGYLKEIRYGQRAGALFSASPAASGKVTFDYAERCVATGTGCDALTKDTRDNWPDVPFDAVCKDGDKCTGNTGPSFFTRKRMTGITTSAWNAAAAPAAFVPVDEWTLKQTYLDPGDTGDSSDQSLWLNEIKHTGKNGTPLSLDPVTFGHEYLANRVDSGSDDILPFHKPRLKTITSEAGAQTIVTYLPADCVAGQAKPKLDENTRRCYPVKRAPNGGDDTVLDWFQKFPVEAVSTTDPRGGSEAVQHIYQYAGGGAWAYNDDPFTKEKDRTWSSWRGFERVTHLTGVPGKTQSKTVSVYLRGMNGDRVLAADGTTVDPTKRKSVQVTGIKASAITDSEQYAGFPRETVTYNGADEVSGSISDPWSKKTATQHKSYADTEAYYVRTAATHNRTNITSGISPRDRVRSTVTTFDDYGMPVTVLDKGDNTVVGDEKCTRTWYARNDAVGINSLVSRTRVTANTTKAADACATSDADLDLPADANRPGDVISDNATAYDTTTWSASQKPVKGDAQWTGRAKAYGADNQPLWQKTATTTHDTLGRPLTVKNTNDVTVSTTAYTPAAAGPLTSSTATNVKGHTVTTLADFATGATQKVTDPNGKITESQYDALGRVTKVWLPNRPRSIGATPNYTYAYSIKSTSLPWVSTSTLTNDGSGYNTSYEIYDSLLRPRQTQRPTAAGGTVIGLTLYDSRGLATSTQGDIWAEKTAPSGTLLATEGGAAPAQTDTTYDGAGRAVKSVTSHFGKARWTSETRYTGDTVSATTAAGGQATTVVSDALGQTTERREYGGPQPTGSDFTTTRFTYTPAGQQATMTGPDGAKWSYGYDLFGHPTSTTDPDKGKGTTTYNELDQAVTSTDARGKTLTTEYDQLGRKTGLWDGTAKTDATKLASWGFDKLAKGQQDTSTRYVDGAGTTGKAYTQEVTSFSPIYQPTGNKLTLPASEPLVSGGQVTSPLASSTVYNVDGTVRQATAPAVGGLPSETVSYKYDAFGQQLSSTGSTGYLQNAFYTPLGDLKQLRLGIDSVSSAKQLGITHDYEPGTRRLTKSSVTDNVHSYALQDLNFTQDEAGNVTSIFDKADLGGTGKTDNQCFTYDGHRRTTEAWTPKTADCSATGRTTANLGGAAPYWSSYTYTGSGQRQTETTHTTTGNTTTKYTYTTPDGQPHPLVKTETETKTSTYGYDKTGNTTSRPGTQAQQTLAWNTEGDLVSTTEPAAGTKPALGTSYLYDASGELLIRRATTGDGDTVLYLGASELRLTTKGTSKVVTGTRYYTAAGQTIALRTATTGVTGTKLSFLTGDHHGTSSLAIDSATLAVTSKRYTGLFGAPRGEASKTWPDDKAFLGKPADAATGLTHIGAREYDPAIGQFISVDPLLTTDSAQSLNGYNYANQHPATSSDPTGLCDDPGNGCMPVNPGSGKTNNNVENGGSKYPVQHGNHYNGKNGGGGGKSNPTSHTSSSGHTSSSSDACGNWLSCGWNKVKSAASAVVDTVSDNWGNIAQVATEVAVGAVCVAGAAAAGAATGGAGFAAVAGCGALAGAAGAAVGNALSDTADHSVGGQLTDMAEGAVWGAAGAVVGLGIAKGISKIFTKCHSFLPGTGVLLGDGTHKAIEDVETGDTVITTDTTSGKTVTKKVVSTITTEDDKNFTDITISTGEELSSIVATDTHPFWVPELRKWVKAGDLEVGQWLRTSAGTHVQITATSHYTKRQRTHDLTIQDIHAYYVLAGATPVLVHNCGGGALDLDNLQDRADTLHALIPAGKANDRATTGVMHAVGGGPESLDVVAVGARKNISLIQRAQLLPHELGISRTGVDALGKFPHTEVKLWETAVHLDLTPTGLAVNRPFCPACQGFLQSKGATLVSDTQAIWTP
ncbi:polymorphic toxin-type HINT domain-containing protein [Streptomyces sp. NPDC004111]|uniref:polymorphic toxin-type HINT domain-containing protein n=1 Tax=Streptomyces sp. NPDC004111 TaxID=3364690 RepID=UPI0036882827